MKHFVGGAEQPGGAAKQGQVPRTAGGNAIASFPPAACCLPLLFHLVVRDVDAGSSSWIADGSIDSSSLCISIETQKK